MLDIIRNLLHGGISRLADLIDRVREAISTLWGTLETFFIRLVTAFGSVISTAADLAVAMLRFSQAMLVMLPWLMLVYIPQKLVALNNAIAGWVYQRLTEVRAFAVRLVTVTRAFAQALVDGLRKLLTWWVNWLRQLIAALRTDLVAIARRVYALLTDPTVLADWLVDAMFHAFIRYANRQAERFGRWIFGHVIRAAINSARLVEQVILRVL